MGLIKNHTGSKNEYFAILYRIEMKKTMRAQLELIKFVRYVFDESYTIQKLVEDGASDTEIGDKFKSLYLTKMDSEKA